MSKYVSDVVRPDHYRGHPSGVECIDVVGHMSFNLGNVVKYLWRAGLKGSKTDDLAKAAWYLERGGLTHDCRYAVMMDVLRVVRHPDTNPFLRDVLEAISTTRPGHDQSIYEVMDVPGLVERLREIES